MLPANLLPTPNELMRELEKRGENFQLKFNGKLNLLIQASRIALRI